MFHEIEVREVRPMVLTSDLARLRMAVETAGASERMPPKARRRTMARRGLRGRRGARRVLPQG